MSNGRRIDVNKNYVFLKGETKKKKKIEIGLLRRVKSSMNSRKKIENNDVPSATVHVSYQRNIFRKEEETARYLPKKRR